MQLTKFNWNRSSEFIIALKLNYTRKRSEDLEKVNQIWWFSMQPTKK